VDFVYHKTGEIAYLELSEVTSECVLNLVVYFMVNGPWAPTVAQVVGAQEVGAQEVGTRGVASCRSVWNAGMLEW
jgi:hypothetical protein